MFYSPPLDETVPDGAVQPTFDSLLVGPADDGGDSGDSTPAPAFFWRPRAWLPPTKHQRGTV